MYPVIRAKDRQKTIIQQCYRLQEVDGENAELEYLQFPKLAEMEQIQHLFTTRTGGVSTEHLASLNLSFSRGDLKEYVLENYRRIGLVMGCSIDRMVASHQTHTTNIRIVSEADAGKGIKFPKFAKVYLKYILPVLVFAVFVVGYLDKFGVL